MPNYDILRHIRTKQPYINIKTGVKNMAIVQELNKSWFMDRFKEMGRGDLFSYEALECLYDYYEELSESAGEDYKLDVIDICCDWYESTVEELINEYDIDVSECEDDEEKQETVIDYLDENTDAITLSNGNILYQLF